MSFKVILVCALVLPAKNIFGQCIGNSYDIGNSHCFSGNNYFSPCGCADAQFSGAQLTIPDSGVVSASCGGNLIVQASSPFAPGSISVQSENQFQGPISVYGTLPFLSAVAFEASLPTQGSGAVTYQCGDGRVAILEENIPASGYDNVAVGNFGEDYNSFGAGWGLARSSINGINNCVESVPNVFGQVGGLNWNKGGKCGCGYYKQNFHY